MRDLSAWVERGLAPPAETSYRVEQGQVVVPGGAGERKGIQPVVTLRANDRESASVAMIETPPGGGKIVGVGWDFQAGPAPVTMAAIRSRRQSVRRGVSC